jgi:hypothetical protein
MPLSSEQFQEIIGSLRSDALFGRRATPRVGMRLQIRITPCVETPPVRQYDAWLRDMSMSGICFVGPVDLPLGSYVVSQFARECATPLSILYEVVRCHKRAENLFEIGARIERVLTDQELKAA